MLLFPALAPLLSETPQPLEAHSFIQGQRKDRACWHADDERVRQNVIVFHRISQKRAFLCRETDLIQMHPRFHFIRIRWGRYPKISTERLRILTFVPRVGSSTIVPIAMAPASGPDRQR